jgi:hypothetical protein
VDLARGAWQKPRRAQHIVMSAFSLIPLGLLATARDQIFITLQHPALDQARYGRTVDSFNKLFHLIALPLCAIAVLSLAWEIVRMSMDAYRKRVAALR